MNIIPAHNLACPIDGRRLLSCGKQLSCDNGHTFDIARQGYVNLLPVQHKRSKHPGDSKTMVSARRHFLNTGIYAPIADKLIGITCAQMTESKDHCILDAGCGEGYYLDKLFDYLRQKEGSASLSFIGLDISKDAVIQSAKRNRQISWAVGTNRQPPVEEASVDIVLCLFGFHSFEGFNKILKPGGKLILLDPGAEHLKELREIIYPEVMSTDPAASAVSGQQGFLLIGSERLKFGATLKGNEMINDLLIMTPHFYRASKSGREAAAGLSKLEISIDVIFRVFEKV